MQVRRGKAALLAATIMLSISFSATPGAAKEIKLPFNPANFSQPLEIDNPLLPMVPGTVYLYRAEGPDGCEENRVTVTFATKAIAAGVTARVVEDIAFEDEDCNGTLVKVEETFDWFAQDNSGNVWYLGEDSKDCDGGICTPSDGSWQAGVDGAVAGIIMLADPQPGEEYYQEFYKDHAEDQARILRTDAWVSLYREDAYGTGDYHNCLKTKEWTKLSPGEIEHKFYCPDVGLVAVDELKGKTLRFELVDIQ